MISSSGSYVYNVGKNSSDETINLAFNKTSAVKVCFKVKTSGGTVSSNKVCSDTVAFTPVRLGLISASKVTTDKNSSYGAVKYKITVPNANWQVKQVNGIQVTNHFGGNGAFREVVDAIICPKFW